MFGGNGYLRNRAALGLVVVAALIAALAGTAKAQPAMATGGGVKATSAAVPRTIAHSSMTSEARILKFWTKKRMAAAKQLVVGASGVSRVATAPKGRSVRIAGTATVKSARRNTRLASTGWWNTSWGRWSMVGRLYVYNAAKGWVGWCSGTAVVSQNRSTIWTAGHCLHGNGRFYTNLLFAPGQNGPGNYPYGRWAVRNVYTPTTWANNSTCTNPSSGKVCPWGSDYGVAIASTANGATLTGRVGSFGIWFGAGLAGKGVLALGYPSSEPYYTQYAGYLFYCDDAVSRSFLDSYGSYQWTKPCQMNGGASGGPWLLRSGTSWYLVSNNSNADLKDASGRPKMPTIMNGPYLGPAAQSFYNYVQSR